MPALDQVRNTGASTLMAGLIAATAIAPVTSAKADVAISKASTSNMTCANGVCTPTAANAVLNVADLENLLATSNVEVTTTGSGVQANNIQVDASLTWSSTSALALDAYQSVLVYKPVSVSGAGGLSVTTNDGGSNGYFGFGAGGNVMFASLSSALTINGASYTLVGDIATLAADIAANASGNFALANSYDAGDDGTYQDSAIPTDFGGNFEGLGNTISNLSINGTGDPYSFVGFFAEISNGTQLGGAIENIVLEKEHISGNAVAAGGLVGGNDGTIAGSFVNGSVASEHHGGLQMGLLVGGSVGTIVRCGAVGTISTSQQAGLGGLVAAGGNVSQSFADVKVSAGMNSDVGGLEGGNQAAISDSYALGEVRGGTASDVGGLVGENAEQGTIAQSYSAGAVRRPTGHPRGYYGGVIGYDYSSSGSNTADYWDTTTSHVANPKNGAGYPKRDRGIAALTSQQLQSGLPAGFDPAVWAEDPKINNGFPYLIANPPRK